MSDVKFGTRLGANWHNGIPSTQEFLDIPRKCEEWGYDFVVAGDHIAGGRAGIAPIVQCFPVLAAAAAVTQKIQVATCVLQLPMYNPAVVARSMLTIDFLSGGRAIMGVGVGGQYPNEWEAAQQNIHDRGKRADEALAIIRQMWTENQIDHHGRFYDLTDISMEPKSQAPDGIPIWVGGSSDAALRRAARFGDGWTSTQMSSAQWQQNMEKVHEFAGEMGRDMSSFQGIHSLAIRIDKDREKARSDARAIVGDGGRVPFDELVEDYVCAGDAEDCARVIRKFVSAGASWFMLSPMGKLDDLMPQLELIAQDLIPKFR